jgi:arylsulfatase A-like enzyme
MNRNRLSFVAAALLLFLMVSCSTPETAPRQPNIVFIFIDDMGYGDLSVTGNTDVETPNIDRLATDGIRFTQFYVNSPICSPSRVAVTTGQYPARHLINSYLNRRERNRARDMRDFLNPEAPAIARAFKQAGYATAHFGKWHMGGGRDVNDAPHPQAYGFDESLVSFEGLGDRILPPGNLSKQSEKLAQGEIRWVDKHEQTPIYVDRSIDFIKRNQTKPIYLHLWLNDVHDAHKPTEEMMVEYEQFSANPYVQKFYAVLVAMDREIGRLVDAIDEMGLAEDTLIVVTSDNGPTAWPRYYKEGFEPAGSTAGFRGRKWSLYEGGIRMPLIARWPGRITPGALDETTVMAAIDLLPTFTAIAGVQAPPAEYDGVDMSAALLGTPQQRNVPIYFEYGRDESYLRPGVESDQSPNLAVRDGRWKLLVNADGTDLQLYDFEASTDERENVADQYPDVVKRLSEQLLTWRESWPVLPPE